MSKFEVLKNSQNLYKVKIYHNGYERFLRDEDLMSLISSNHVSEEILFTTMESAIEAANKYFERLTPKEPCEKHNLNITDNFKIFYKGN